jgi:hypothetical protein
MDYHEFTRGGTNYIKCKEEEIAGRPQGWASSFIKTKSAVVWSITEVLQVSD